MNIPERYEDVTAGWLTEALRSGGVIGDQEVSNFKIEPLRADQSLTSSLARITVVYDEDSEVLPSSMFAKFVSGISANRGLAARLGIFRREIVLYKTLGNSIPLNIPKLYFGLVSEQSDTSVLLMEDIKAVSKASLPPEKRLLTSGEAILGVNELAKMHAKWWGDQALGEYQWLLSADNDTWRQTYQSSYDEAWSKTRGILEPVLTPAEAGICRGLSGYLTTLQAQLGSMPETLCHGDLNQGNLLWDSPGNPSSVWFVDWQFSARAPAVLDVALFLGMGVGKSHTRLIRQNYLPAYHDALVNSGVTLYDYQQFLNDYRFALLDRLSRIMTLLSDLNLTKEESVDMIRLRVGNMAGAAEDAGCADLVF